MKKYYWVNLYQVTKGTAYLKNNNKYAFTILNNPYSEINPKINSFILEEKEIIMVEKIAPYQVREVKTGITLPIVDIIGENIQYYLLNTHFRKPHTFVFSINNKLISKEVVSTKELELYNINHPNPQMFKNELLEIIKQGQINVINKIEREKKEKEIEKELKLREKIQLKTAINNQRQEKIKVRKLQHQFKQERKNI